MCEAVGHPVGALTRTRIGPLIDARLAIGRWRDLSETEVMKLRALADRPAGSSADAAISPSVSSSGSTSSRGVCSISPAGGSKPSASAMSSIFGRSERSFSPNRMRNSFVVEYMKGRPDHVLAADDLDQVALQQRREHARVFTPANLADLERRDRLTVGDHRQGLQTRHGQLLRRAFVEQAAHPLVQFGARDDLEPAGHLHQLQPGRFRSRRAVRRRRPARLPSAPPRGCGRACAA
jgi:hypothetical protein